MDVQTPFPQTTLAILLGASEWPESPDFPGSKAFANAIGSFRSYLFDPRRFGLPKENALDLFDVDDSPHIIDRKIRQFLDGKIAEMKLAGNVAKDLLVYFVGHGGFVGRNSDYYLAVRCTSTEDARLSGIPMESLASTLTDKARYLRRIIILDCCYAAAAFTSFQAEGPAKLGIDQTFNAFEKKAKAVGKGTALLCSSGKTVASQIAQDQSCTMFSKALLQVLFTGDERRQEQHYFSLREVADLTEEVIMRELEGKAPRPEVHSPDQKEGDVALTPFFPNPALKVINISHTSDVAQTIEEHPRKSPLPEGNLVVGKSPSDTHISGRTPVTENIDDLMTVGEVAREARVGKSVVRRWMEQGALEFVVSSDTGKHHIRRSTLKAFLATATEFDGNVTEVLLSPNAAVSLPTKKRRRKSSSEENIASGSRPGAESREDKALEELLTPIPLWRQMSQREREDVLQEWREMTPQEREDVLQEWREMTPQEREQSLYELLQPGPEYSAYQPSMTEPPRTSWITEPLGTSEASTTISPLEELLTPIPLWQQMSQQERVQMLQAWEQQMSQQEREGVLQAWQQMSQQEREQSLQKLLLWQRQDKALEELLTPIPLWRQMSQREREDVLQEWREMTPQEREDVLQEWREMTPQEREQKMLQEWQPGVARLCNQCGTWNESSRAFCTNCGENLLLTEEVEVGRIYIGTVRRLVDFGAFVEILPGKEGLVRTSQLADYQVMRPEDVVSVGDEISVMVVEVDQQGRIILSRRAALSGELPDNPASW